MSKHIFTGFGFGPIQAGLFANEAFQSGNFSRIVIAEIDQELVDVVRANNGSYYVNVAAADGIEVIKIAGVEILNPNVDKDRRLLIEALSCSTEIVTSLPSVSFYDTGDNSVASIISSGLQNSEAKAIIVYAAENDNHAAEILEEVIAEKINPSYLSKVQFLNTVIGKMSQVVSEPAEILENGLEPIAPNLEKAFLVEEFNRILVNRSCLPDFKPGIEVFIEKDDLLPFEEAKLYGHNVIHALLAYLGAFKGYSKMKEFKNDERIMKIAKDAFVNESGAALIMKYSHLNDELFTEAGADPLDVELHVIRLNDVVICTNPFELYLDYGLRIEARSKAALTLTSQLTAGRAGYLPTSKAVRGRGYSAEVYTVGPEGGQVLVDETVKKISQLWD